MTRTKPTPTVVTRTTDDVDELAGVRFADPYRWLEGDGPEVQRWQDEQGEAAADFLGDWPHFAELRASVAAFSTARFEPIPRAAGGRWFRTTTPEHRVAGIRDEGARPRAVTAAVERGEAPAGASPASSHRPHDDTTPARRSTPRVSGMPRKITGSPISARADA